MIFERFPEVLQGVGDNTTGMNPPLDPAEERDADEEAQRLADQTTFSDKEALWYVYSNCYDCSRQGIADQKGRTTSTVDDWRHGCIRKLRTIRDTLDALEVDNRDDVQALIDEL